MALGRENYLFAGSNKGGEQTAAIDTLIQAVRVNFVDPEAWPRDVLTRIAEGYPANHIAELAHGVLDARVGQDGAWLG